MIETLFISDMDGTLLDGDARLSETTVELLNRAIADGALFTVATARTPATVDPLLSRIRDKRLPAIVMTGAAFWDFTRREYINPKFISADTTRAIDAAFAEAGLFPFVYTLPDSRLLHVYHAGPSLNRAEQKFYDDRRAMPLKRFHLHESVPAGERASVVLYLAMGPIQQTVPLARRLREETDVAVSDYRDTYNPDLGLIEVFAPGVSKAAAVKELAARLGSPETIVFGDNLNDIDMMNAADCAVAVANALPEVKAAADIVIGPNTASSVAAFIADTQQKR